MPTYLQRFQAGEHERVWAELQALGAGVRAEPIYSAARAVARETMLRVRRDIETLIARLDVLGYTFYADQDAYTDAPWGKPGNQEYPPRLATPDADAGARLDEIERDVGLFPLSLRAFYEVVGAVNLIGEPARDPGAGDDVNIIEGWPAAAGWRICVEMDPLFIEGLRTNYRSWQELRGTGEGRARYRPLLFPDFLVKYHIAGVGPVQVDFPCDGMDGPLRFEGSRLTGPEGGDFLFVDYLRFALLRRGGFAGIGMPEYPGRPPLEQPLLSRLTSGLLPF